MYCVVPIATLLQHATRVASALQARPTDRLPFFVYTDVCLMQIRRCNGFIL